MSVRVEDLGEVWKIEVSKAYIGLQMREEWAAQAFKKGPTGRWTRMSKKVVNPESPINAVSDLLSALDLGLLVK